MFVELLAVIGLMFIILHVYRFLNWCYKNYEPLRHYANLLTYYATIARKENKPVIAVWREAKEYTEQKKEIKEL